MRILIFLFFTASISSISGSLRAQETETKNVLLASVGYTYIPKADKPNSSEADGYFVPTVGLDYFRILNEKLELGVMLDMELKDYLIVEEGLNRENPLLVIFATQYRFVPAWSIILGGGVEFEHEKNLGVFRVGIERSFLLPNEWKIAIPIFFDSKKEYGSLSLNLAIGKEF